MMIDNDSRNAEVTVKCCKRIRTLSVKCQQPTMFGVELGR